MDAIWPGWNVNGSAPLAALALPDRPVRRAPAETPGSVYRPR